jgi:hypothetical protein
MLPRISTLFQNELRQVLDDRKAKLTYLLQWEWEDGDSFVKIDRIEDKAMQQHRPIPVPLSIFIHESSHVSCITY